MNKYEAVGRIFEAQKRTMELYKVLESAIQSPSDEKVLAAWDFVESLRVLLEPAADAVKNHVGPAS